MNYQFKPMDEVVCINNTNDTKIQPGFVGYVIYVMDDKMCITDNRSSLNARNYLVNTRDFAPANHYANHYTNHYANLYEQMIKPMFKVNEENKKKGNDIMKLLAIYEEKQEEKIKKYFDEKREIAEMDDEIVTRVKALEKELKEEFKDIYIDLAILWGDYTNTTQAIINDLENERIELRNKLRDKLTEIKAQLEICETYEQKIKVLENYDVIDKKTHQVI